MMIRGPAKRMMSGKNMNLKKKEALGEAAASRFSDGVGARIAVNRSVWRRGQERQGCRAADWGGSARGVVRCKMREDVA